MKRKIAFILCLSFFACERILAPEVIPPEKMKFILRDLMISSGIVDLKTQNLRSKDNIRRDLNEELLHAYGISKEDFFNSYTYYIEHAVEMDTMFQWIIKDLQRIQQQVPPEVIKDTLSVAPPTPGSLTGAQGALAKPQ